MTIGSNIVDNGTIGLTKSGAGTLILTGANTYTGTTTINTGTLQVGAAGTTGTLGSGGAVVDNAALSFNRTDALTVGNAISGTGTVTQAGSGSTTLTSANTYTGGTTVGAGTLFVNNASGSGTGTGTVTVNGTGTLSGSGTISGAVNVSASGATINPGATAGAIGTLNTGALTLSNSSKFSVDMLSGSGNADQINVTGGVNITLASLQLNIPNGTAFAAGDQYTLINNDLADAISGTFSNAAPGTDTINGYQWIVTYTGGDGNDFVITAVPEPGTWFAAALALGAIGFTQRKRVRLYASSAVKSILNS